MFTVLPTRAVARALGIAIPEDRDLSVSGLMAGEPAYQALEVAICWRALKLYPSSDMLLHGARVHDEQLAQGAAAGDTAHVVATGLVLSLSTGWGFPGGEPPTEFRERYDKAEAVVEYWSGRVAPADDCPQTFPETPDKRGNDAEHARDGTDLAIRLICDPRPLEVLVADAAADVLYAARDAGKDDKDVAMARARRMLRVVAPRDGKAFHGQPRLEEPESWRARKG